MIDHKHYHRVKFEVMSDSFQVDRSVLADIIIPVNPLCKQMCRRESVKHTKLFPEFRVDLCLKEMIYCWAVIYKGSTAGYSSITSFL
jgi:hypothetical protein